MVFFIKFAKFIFLEKIIYTLDLFVPYETNGNCINYKQYAIDKKIIFFKLYR